MATVKKFRCSWGSVSLSYSFILGLEKPMGKGKNIISCESGLAMGGKSVVIALFILVGRRVWDTLLWREALLRGSDDVSRE